MWQNSKSDKTQKLKMWQNFKKKTLTFDKTQNSKCENKIKSKCQKNPKLKLIWQNLKNSILTTKKCEQLKNSIGDKTYELKLWQDSKAQNMTKIKTSKCEEEKNSKLQMLLRTKTPNGAKLNSECDKTKKLKLHQNSLA